MTARLKQIKDKKKHEEEMNVLGTVGVDVTGNVESGELQRKRGRRERRKEHNDFKASLTNI